MKGSVVERALIVPGLPHVMLAPDRSPGWQALNRAYARAAEEIATAEADLILYFSTQWLSVIGYLFQANPRPEWTLVDMEWHELGSIPYTFTVDADFAPVYAEEVKACGYHTACVNYHGFPIDTGTVVAQKMLNPDNRLPAAMVSCNMYSEKNEMLQVGHAAARALARTGKKAVVVLVSNLSNRFFIDEIDPAHDRISSAKDHEWNLKVNELLGEGRVEDLSQCARQVATEANGDMGFRGFWWLNGLLGQTNHFRGEVFEYQPVWGTGAAVARLLPTRPVIPLDHLELESESEVIDEATLHDPKLRGKTESSLAHPAAQQGPASVGGDPRPAAFVGGDAVGATADPAPVHTADAKPVAATPGDGRIEAPRAPEPVGAYPHARREGEFLFLSGIGPRKPGTRDIPGVTLNEAGEIQDYDIEVQTRSVIENVHAVLAAAGSTLEKVVDVQVFLTNMKDDFATFNRVYGETFAAIGATRTTVEVRALPTPIAVEFKVVARA